METKERLLSGDYQPDTYLLYETRPNVCCNVRIVVKMKENVYGNILNCAVNKAIKRYPYFSVKVEKDGDKRYVLKPNELPISVIRTLNPPPPLGSEEVNYHLISVDYIGKMIFFNFNHSISGACGFIPFIKTVLYLYISEKYGFVPDPTGFNLPDSPMLEDETDFPIAEELPDEPTFGMYTGGMGYFPVQDYMTYYSNPNHVSDGYYCIKIPQNELMRYVKSNDGSPAAVFSVFMFKAFSSVFPHDTQDVLCGMANNYRAQVGCPNSYHDLTRALHIKYTRQMADMPIDKLCTVTRGMVMLQSQPENAVAAFKELNGFYEKLDSMNTIDEKRAYCMKAGRFVGGIRDTYNVSYVGQTDFGSISDYIKSIYTISTGHLLTEINSFKDYFYVCFCQSVNNGRYIESLMNVLENEGIKYDISGMFTKNLPDLKLPE
ncbi:MAG: hypothetical protein ACI4E1_10435 [Lachnospira sp.]